MSTKKSTLYLIDTLNDGTDLIYNIMRHNTVIKMTDYVVASIIVSRDSKLKIHDITLVPHKVSLYSQEDLEHIIELMNELRIGTVRDLERLNHVNNN